MIYSCKFNMASIKIVTVITVVDVMLAAILINVYIFLMSNNLPELQLIKGSRKQHIIVYMYVSLCTIVQLLFAFKFYRTLAEPQDDPDEDNSYSVLSMAKYWLIASYFLLFNWIVKSGIYAQQCECGMSVALSVYLIEIIFRISSICYVNSFITQLEKDVEATERRLKLKSLSARRKARSKESDEP